MTKVRKIEDDIRKAYFLPPFNVVNNYLAWDGYFFNDCIEYWGKDIWDKKVKEVKRCAEAQRRTLLGVG